MKRKPYRPQNWGDNPMRAWFKTSDGRRVRILCWDNFEPCETGGGAPRHWMILRRSPQWGKRLKTYEKNFQGWLDELATELFDGKAVLMG